MKAGPARWHRALSSRVTDPNSRHTRTGSKGGEYLKAPSAESAELVAAMFAAEIGGPGELSGLLLERPRSGNAWRKY